MSEPLPNVVLVVFDTARRDRFGCYGYSKPATPTVDSLAAQGMLAESMIANAPWTSPSHASLFTGLYPSQHGLQWRGSPRIRDSAKVTMAEWFKSLGYETVCVTNNGLISERTGLARGFDRYAFRLDLEKGFPRIARRMEKLAFGGDSGGRIVNRWMRRTLPRVRKPMFLFVNYLECHWAWAPPPGMIGRIGGPNFGMLEGLRYRKDLAAKSGPWEAVARASERELAIYSTLYDGELASADDHLADLLDILQHSGHLAEDGSALVIVTSDHGEHLGERGLADHHASLDEILTGVPFVAWSPGVIAPGRRDGISEFVDVLPSLAALLGGEPPATYLDGRRRDVLTTSPRGAAEEYAISEWSAWSDSERQRLARRNPSYDFNGLARDLVSIRDARHKLVRAAGEPEHLFDLESDPGETTDISAANYGTVERLGRTLDRAIESWRPWRADTPEVSEQDRLEIEKRLSELGYI